MQGCLLYYVANRLSPTRDEPANLAAGLEYWDTGSSLRYSVNPPLVKLWATLPLHFLCGIPAPQIDLKKQQSTNRFEFELGRKLVAKTERNFFGYLVYARLMCILLTLAGTLGVYCLAGLWFGHNVSLWAAAIWALNPITLGFGALITCDIPSASIGAWASYCGITALRDSRIVNILVAGGMFGLAILTKLTWLLAIPIAVLLAVLYFRRQNPGVKWGYVAERVVLGLCLFLATAWSLVATGYRFEGLFSPLGDYEFVSKLLTGGESHGNRFRNGMFQQFPLPIPSPMLLGMDQQWQDFDEPLDCYLAGKWQRGGWYYYYVSALLLKLPLGLLVSVALAIPNFRKNAELSFICMLLITTILVVVSLKTNMNEHTRYLWIFLPQIIVLSTCAFVDSVSIYRRTLAVICMLWCIGAGVLSVPCGISYFNELAIVSNSSQPLLAGSNIDWGHGWVIARDWLKQQEYSEFPIVVISTHIEELNAIGIQTSEYDPVVDNNSTLWVIALVGIDDRMRLQRDNKFLVESRVLTTERIGCCVECYRVQLNQLPHRQWAWARRSGNRI